MRKNKIENDSGVNEEKSESFFVRMKKDKKYNAKVQLIGYGAFILILIIYLNLSSLGSGSSVGNRVLGDVGGSSEKENISRDDNGLLESVSNNYNYNMVISIKRQSMNTETGEEVITDEVIKYSGKASKNKLEIKKTVGEVNDPYYKLDDNYYSMIDNVTSYVKDVQVYNVVDADYVELDNILDLIEKASLDYVTEFSSGKKVSVYNLKVKDIILTYQGDEVVEFNIEEDNGVVKFKIDYSNFFKVIDESISSCILEFMVSDINKVEDFEVIVSAGDGKDVELEDENTSLE